MNVLLKNVLTSMFCLLALGLFSQNRIDLSEKFQNEEITAVNRDISLYEDAPKAIEMNARNSDGLGIMEGVNFESGTIEIELLGENNPGKSFIGIAFNIQDDHTYEVIYFRPFNFVATEQIRKDHMVQYVFHPEFTWGKLRAERTGEYEDEIPTPPNPDDWFKAIIKVTEATVEVYVEELAEPVLVVDRLTNSKSGKIGIWTGFGSSGRYRNLTLKAE